MKENAREKERQNMLTTQTLEGAEDVLGMKETEGRAVGFSLGIEDGAEDGWVDGFEDGAGLG